jgi:uncharacterized protein YhaN
MALTSTNKLRQVIDDMPDNAKGAQSKLRQELDAVEAAHQQELQDLNRQLQTARDQAGAASAGMRISGPGGMEGDELSQFLDEAENRRRERLLDAPFSAGEIEALTDPLYGHGGEIMDPLDPRPLRTPIEAAVEKPALVLNRARGI